MTSPGLRLTRWFSSLFILAAASAGATTIVMPSDAQLIAKSPVIVSGTVASATPFERDGVVWTETRIRVANTFKGEAREEAVIREIGGVVGDHITKIFGAPQYTAGEHVLVFLTPSPRGDFQTTDLFVGKLTEMTSGGQRLWVRENTDAVTLLDGSFAPMLDGNIQRLATPFEAFIAGHGSPADYEVRIDSKMRQGANFTLLSEPSVYRWTQFDNGGSVNWLSYGAQTGYKDGGVEEAKTAIATWTNYASARIRYVYSGSFTSAPSGHGRVNGINEILFNDPLGEIAGTFNPGTGGVVGSGGFNGVSGSVNWTGPFAADAQHGTSTYRAAAISEANLVIQDGVTPGNGLSSNRLAEIIAHELGHTLGFGHSEDTTALMYRSVSGLGPSLRADDQLAARWLYPNPTSTTPNPLTASYAFSPANPLTGDIVSFTDRTSGGATAWQWTFGDGTSSTLQNPAKTYSQAGAYTITLTASRGTTTSVYSQTISVGARTPVLPANLSYQSLVSAAVQSNVWRTELTLFNAGAEPISIDVTFLPGTGGAIQTRSIFLSSRQSRVYSNALLDIYGITTGSGALAIEATGPTMTPVLKISSRTFNSGISGTYGQGIPDVVSSDLQKTLYLTGLISTDDFRTNLGLVNRSNSPLGVTLTLLNADGTVAGVTDVVVAANNFQQTGLASYFPAVAGRSLSALSMQIVSAAPDSLSAYASVVDNRTQDPIYLQATPQGIASSLTLPMAGRTEGANGTFWRSDVTLFNPSITAQTVSVSHRGQTRSFRVSARGTLVIADVSRELGFDSGSGIVEMSWSGLPPIVSSRTYTASTAGATYGQSIEPIDSLARELYVTGLRSDGSFRSNVGLVNGGTTALTAEVSVLNMFGAKLASATVTIPAKGVVQSSLASLFPSIDVVNLGSFTIQATAPAPSLFVYGSMVDNTSGDPVFFGGR